MRKKVESVYNLILKHQTAMQLMKNFLNSHLMHPDQQETKVGSAEETRSARLVP